MSDYTLNPDLQECNVLQAFLVDVLERLPNGTVMEMQPIYFKAHDYYMEKNYKDALVHYKQVEAIIHKLSLPEMCQCSDAANDTVKEKNMFTPFEPQNPIYFDDIAGLEECKRLIREVLIYPTRYPHLIPDKPRGVMGIMLFGFPGCGKSLLAQATSAEIEAPFYNVQLSQLQSKYRGESENRVRKLFNALRQHDVAVLFLDEFDAVTNSRDGKDSMLAFKNELLVEMSGVGSNSKSNFIVILAATNMPDMVDSAFLSRFPHKLYVPLPNTTERLTIIDNRCTKLNVVLCSETREFLEHRTKGFSGRDISAVLETLRYVPLRKIRTATHFRISEVCMERKTTYAVTTADNADGFPGSFDVLGLDNIEQPPITEDDVMQAFKTCPKPRRQCNDGMVNFARKHANSKSIVTCNIGEIADDSSWCANPLLCCLWGR